MSLVNDEVALPVILAELRRRWLSIVMAMIFSMVVVVSLTVVKEEEFEASVILSPVAEETGSLGGSGSLLSQFGGLAALGGISFGGGNKATESIATLKSAVLTEQFIREKNLLPELFHESWDEKNKTWKVGLLGKILGTKEPSVWLAEEKFREQIRFVSEDKKTGLVRLSIRWRDPIVAANWANDLVNRANRYLRTEAIERSNKNLNYLNAQLAKTTVVELQAAIYSLIEAEIKQVMVASGSDEYAFKVIDNARPPERSTRPSLLLMAIVGCFVGLIMSLAVIWIRSFSISRPTSSNL